MVNQYVVDRKISKYGESVTLKSVTNTFSKWGDRSSTTSSSTITVVHNDIQGDEQFNQDGRFRPGDKVFFAKSGVSISVGDIITFDSVDYEVKDSIRHNIQNKNFVTEARCSKI